MTTRIFTSAVKHRCRCARLLGISIANTFHAKQRRARIIAAGTHLVCDRCKRATVIPDFEPTRL
jgi:hypothetical protein